MRGKRAPKRLILPDEKYNSVLVSKLINYVMYDGKKNVARTIVHNALEQLATKTKSEPVEALQKAMDNIKPRVEVRAKRVGGANLQVPVPVPAERQNALAFRWLLASVRGSRGSKESWEVLANELAAAFHGEGNAIKKKMEAERMAEANKAFAQFNF